MNKLNLKSEEGFTLIELMFVAFLFLLFAGFSAALFHRSLYALGTDMAANNLLQLFQFAHERAILERIDYGVHLVPGENVYALLRRDPSVDIDFVRIQGKWGTSRHLPSSVEIKGDDTWIYFYPDGTSSPATFQLSGRDHTTTLTMDPVLGRGMVHETS